MSTARERAAENATEIASTVVLGLGLLALFTGFSPVPFWVIFAVGFAVVVPIVAILAGDEDESDREWWNDERWNWWGRDGDRRHEKSTERDEPTADALATLRARYARGDLTDEQFERKLDSLLETEQPESAAEWRTRKRERARTERERT